VQFWGLWFLVFLAPVLQIFPFGIWVADRYLYVPAIGFFVLVSKGFFHIADRLGVVWQKVGWEMAMGAVLVLFAWQTHRHLPAWQNNVTLWEATTPTCNTSAYCHGSLGSSLLRAGYIERGVKELIHAVQLRPDPRFLIRLGDAYTLALKDYRQAQIAYRMAREQGGQEINAAFYSKLARLYIITENWEEARQAIQAGMQADDRDPSLLVVNGFLEWRQGNLAAARRSLGIALVITGQTAQPAELITNYWGDAADAGKLLADLRAAREANPPAATPPHE
jgi:tetratricopeptide (TPR) repeat protein